MLPNHHRALPTLQRPIAFALSMALLAPVGVAADKGSGHGSGASHTRSSSATAHVKGYTRSRTASASRTHSPSPASSARLYTVRDPATGRTTYTNAPARYAGSASSSSAPRSPRGKPSAAAPQHGAANHGGDRCASCERDASGRILRSAEAKDAFKRQTGYPHGRPGYVIDHVVPLACGGADAPTNMQWQTKEAAAAKDKTERIGCHR